MSVLVKSNPMILEAQRELKIFSSDKENRELVRSRRKFINDSVIIIDAAKTEEKLETARRMISKGYDTDAIIDITGLSKEEIEQLRAGVKNFPG